MARPEPGRFRPNNVKKYRGDPTNIIYRSSWELRMMTYFDKHPDVIEWGSEEIIVPYVSPIDSRPHRYFPDFIVKKRGRDGLIEVMMIEVKPSQQCKEPRIRNKRTRAYIREVHEWVRNQAKWEAADAFCKDRNWKFSVFTEKEIGVLCG